MVYVSYSSELGTLYTKQGLSAIKRVCEDYGLKLFVDGARLGTGLTSEASDMSMKDIADLCDVFYIGGTKNGALLGEAVVFPEPETVNLRHFTTIIKQQGGLLAKGRLLGIQFEGLFTESCVQGEGYTVPDRVADKPAVPHSHTVPARSIVREIQL